MSFKHLNIITPILRSLEQENYVIPTPIQEQAIPPILEGRDLLGCAQTGTGKTAAFAIPILHLLSGSGKQANAQDPSRKIRALILTPTRELALQIYESFCTYGKHTGLQSCVVFGGVPQGNQERALRRGVDILVATPGRLVDLMNQKVISLQNIEILTLDEADRMLDMGFIHDVKKIIAKTPAKRQNLLFSATMPPEIVAMSKSLLHNAVRVSITPESPTVDAINQSIYHVDKKNKRHLLLHLLQDPSLDSVLVFTRTKHGADRVVRDLTRGNVSSQAIHGNKSQNARQRALANFKNRKIRVLVATDIAARGIDIDELTHVINFDLPEIPESYVHRIGRTGRAGHNGTAISFCDFDEKKLLNQIEKLCAKSIPKISDHPYPMLITTESEPKPTFRPQPGRRKTNQQSGRRNSNQRSFSANRR